MAEARARHGLRKRMRRESPAGRLRDRRPDHERHSRRSDGSLRALLAKLFRRVRRFHGRDLHRERRPDQRFLRHLSSRHHPADRYQIHSEVLQGQPRHPRRRHLVHQRRSLRRHPQSGPGRAHAGLPQRTIDRVGVGGLAHHRNRRDRARRHARQRKIALRGRAQFAADQDRRKLRAAERFPRVLLRVRPSRAGHVHLGFARSLHDGGPRTRALARAGR